MKEDIFNALEPLPHPVYFVCKNQKIWGDVMRGEKAARMGDLHDRFRDAKDSWGTQPYIQLKQRGLDVHLVPKLVPGKICIVSYDQLQISDLPYQSFVVCCRHDRGVPHICNQSIVQNQENILRASDFFLPHWPQPYITPRDKSRGARVETIAYKGRLLNLAEPFRSESFRRKLNELGFQLQVSPEEESARVADSRDYSQVDVTLAVRDCTEYNLSLKPASKLFNAWIAGTPAILGPESAFQQLRKGPLDFCEVRTPEEVLNTLTLLRDNPSLYTAMVKNGQSRAQEFGASGVAQKWRDLLAVPIAKEYSKWLSDSFGIKRFLDPLGLAVQAIQHRKARKYFSQNIHNGKRPVNGKSL